MNYLATALSDIAARNAGKPVLTIWADGSYVVHGAMDAEIMSRCEPAMLDLDIATMNPMIFRTREELQTSIRLHERLLGPVSRAASGTPTRRAETTGSVGEADGGPVPKADAQ